MLMPNLGELLIVDDDAELMAWLRQALAELGYNTLGYTSGDAAPEALSERDFDLLLVDLTMPEIDGIALLKAGLGIDPDLVGIIMVEQGAIETTLEAMKVGAFDYVLKPLEFSALLPVLSRAMELRRLRMENLHLRETVAIYELAKAIAFTLDMNVILSKIADAALQQCKANETSIMLPAPEGKELYVAIVRGEQRHHILGQRVPIDRGVAGWVARHHEPLVLHGEVDDPRFMPVKPRVDIRSAISMPMLVGGRLVGVLNVNSTRARRPFTLGQVKALTILVSTAASALEGAQLYLQLRAAEEKYRSIFENAVEGIYQLSPDGRYMAANPALARILGYESPEELLASVTDLEHQLHVEPHRWAERKRLMAERGSVVGFEYQVCRKDGTVIWVSENSRAVRDAAGTLLHDEGTVQDITEHKGTEQRLLRAQRLEMAGRIAAQVAHDFNNLLVPLAAYPELIKMRLPEGHPAVPWCDTMLHAARQMAEINGDMMALGRRGHSEQQPTDLNALVEQAVGNLVTKPETLVVDLDLACGMLPVKGSPAQLLRVVTNLVSNAREAMGDVGLLYIKTETVYVDRPIGRYNRVELGEYAELSVTDTGCGIPAGIRDRIFDPFFTTKSADGKHGSGLGLGIVQGIVEDHGGYIDVESEVGSGSTFSVFLPVCRDAVNQRPSAGIPGGTEVILVIDDDLLQREAVSQMLQPLGYRVDAAASGEEGLAHLRQHPADLLILDMIMPGGIDGAETYRRVLQVRPRQRAIIVSGYAESERVREAQKLGAGPYLRKPMTVKKLAQAVREELDGRRTVLAGGPRTHPIGVDIG